MSADKRREEIIKEIENANSKPISASKLAAKFNVSRQIIVGDIAILRAGGYDITATARGYIMIDHLSSTQYIAKIASNHKPQDIKDELYTIVDLGGTITNVIIEHEIYGELTGNLNLSNRNDVDEYIDRLKSSKAKPLSDLTSGIHLHTIECVDQMQYRKILKALNEKNYLVNN